MDRDSAGRRTHTDWGAWHYVQDLAIAHNMAKVQDKLFTVHLIVNCDSALAGR